MTLTETWTNDIVVILNNIRINSVLLSKYHKKTYIVLQGKLRYFRIPIIILSAISSLFNLGLSEYMSPQNVSLLCAILSLITGLIGSIELYLQIQRILENSLIHSRDFYLLAVEIQKCLLLTPENRNGDATIYLDGIFNDYTRLIETSNIINTDINDELTPIPIDIIKKMSYEERVRNNFIIDEQHYIENFQTYEISTGLCDISNILIPPNNRTSRSNSVESFASVFRKESISDNLRSIHSRIFNYSVPTPKGSERSRSSHNYFPSTAEPFPENTSSLRRASPASVPHNFPSTTEPFPENTSSLRRASPASVPHNFPDISLNHSMI
jgi:hypothetical protein